MCVVACFSIANDAGLSWKQMPVLHVNLFDGKAEIVRKQVFLLLFKLKKTRIFQWLAWEQERFPGLSQTWIHRINIIKANVTLFVIICQAFLQSQVLPYVRASLLQLRGVLKIAESKRLHKPCYQFTSRKFNAVSINKWFQTKQTMSILGRIKFFIKMKTNPMPLCIRKRILSTIKEVTYFRNSSCCEHFAELEVVRVHLEWRWKYFFCLSCVHCSC